jgi:hypothetical protein
MATKAFYAATGAAPSRFFPGSLWRTLLTWSEELNRALAAAHRYERLTIRQKTGERLRDRGAKARQVFLEMYAGSFRPPGSRCTSTFVKLGYVASWPP